MLPRSPHPGSITVSVIVSEPPGVTTAGGALIAVVTRSGHRISAVAAEAVQLLASSASLTFSKSSAHARTRYVPSAVVDGTVTDRVAVRVAPGLMLATLRVPVSRTSLASFAASNER